MKGLALSQPTLP